MIGQINSLYRLIRDEIELFLRSMGCDESLLHMANSRVSMALPTVIKREIIESGNCKSDSGTEEDNEEIVKAFEIEIRTFINESSEKFSNEFIVEIEISNTQH